MTSGIYEILHIESGRRYVGSSVNIPVRWTAHRAGLRSGKHPNAHLQRAWTKHGAAAFAFTILEVVEPASLRERETFHIDARNAHRSAGGYNQLPTAHSRLGVKHSAETKRQISLSKLGHTYNLGQRRTDETRCKMSVAQRGRPKTADHRAKLAAAGRGKIIPSEVRRKMSQTNTGRPKPVGFGRRVAEAQAFFTAEEVPTVREMHRSGMSARQLDRHFGTNHTLIGKVIRGEGSFYSTV